MSLHSEQEMDHGLTGSWLAREGKQALSDVCQGINLSKQSQAEMGKSGQHTLVVK